MDGGFQNAVGSGRSDAKASVSAISEQVCLVFNRIIGVSSFVVMIKIGK